MLLTEAPVVWNLLNGVVCVYKSAGETVSRVRRNLLLKLCTELNLLECRPPRIYRCEETYESGEKRLIVRPSFADHPLVVGPRYQIKDFKCVWATFLGSNTSGVFVLGLNNGTKDVYNIHNSYPMRTYHVKGQFGYLTDNLFKTGKVLDRNKFNHIKESAVERLVASIQASHQRKMFDLSGVDIQSQEAYDLAVKGLVRPTKSSEPLIYGIKCTEFNPPDFTIEVHCINEYEAYLMTLIQTIGYHLNTSATCTNIQCTKHSYFTLNHALLKKHWELEHVISNMAESRRLIRKQGKFDKTINKSIAVT